MNFLKKNVAIIFKKITKRQERKKQAVAKNELNDYILKFLNQ